MSARTIAPGCCVCFARWRLRATTTNSAVASTTARTTISSARHACDASGTALFVIWLGSHPPLSALAHDHRYLAKPGARPYCSAQPQVVSLPPFESWAPAELKEKHAPKLPEAFWQKHGPKPHCVIRSPHAPIPDGDW